tara:strand:+ start:574 stop:1251 length:678 start_codon:yes stop_codon:yes gene_type:complete
MKVLNLYACLGGNRLLWDNCEVTAVELDPELATLYKERFPHDKVLVEDAHQYLLNNYKNFDFIWSSPPCPSHSRAKVMNSKAEVEYPDMTLYQQIIFLKHKFKGRFCIENVVPYYEPLIAGKKRGRHIFWTNFDLPEVVTTRQCEGYMRAENEIKLWEIFHKIDLSKYKGKQRKDKIARNLVDYETGKTIFEAARGNPREADNQISFFEAYEKFMEKGVSNVVED